MVQHLEGQLQQAHELIEDVQAQVQAVVDMQPRRSQRKRKKKRTLRRSRECLESSRDLGLREDVDG